MHKLLALKFAHRNGITKHRQGFLGDLQIRCSTKGIDTAEFADFSYTAFFTSTYLE